MASNVPANMEATLPVPEVLAEVPASTGLDWETQMVRRSQSGDRDAFRLLVERYQGRVFSIAHTLIRSRADVEDIAQQVFTKVFFRIRDFDFRAALITWIYKITINECYNHLRKQRSRRLLCVSEMTEAEARHMENTRSTAPSPQRKAELAQMVSLLLSKVSAEERLLLLMKEAEGYSIEDLSRLFACNENTIKVKLFRARGKLAQLANKKHLRSRNGRRN
jgi:RNA polymerase sigma-70 factor, ECF subfamily